MSIRWVCRSGLDFFIISGWIGLSLSRLKFFSEAAFFFSNSFGFCPVFFTWNLRTVREWVQVCKTFLRLRLGIGSVSCILLKDHPKCEGRGSFFKTMDFGSGNSVFSFFFLKRICFESVELQRKGETDCCFAPQMARAGQRQGQELLPDLPLGWQGLLPLLEPSSPAFRGAIAGKRIGSGAAKTWILGCSSISYVIVPVPEMQLLIREAAEAQQSGMSM